MRPRGFQDRDYYLGNDHLFALAAMMQINIYTVSTYANGLEFQAHSVAGYHAVNQWPNIFINYRGEHYEACTRPRIR